MEAYCFYETFLQSRGSLDGAALLSRITSVLCTSTVPWTAAGAKTCDNNTSHRVLAYFA